MRTKPIERSYKKIFEVEDADAEFKQFVLAVKDHSSSFQNSEKAIQALERFSEFVDSIELYQDHQEKMLVLAQRNLETSSKELFEKVTQIQAMMRSLGEGYIVFGRDRVCLPIFSKISEELFEIVPAGQNIAKVLRIQNEKENDFNLWCKHIFEETIDFDDLVAIGPKLFNSNNEKYITLKFKPIRNDQNKIEHLIMIARDSTAEKKAADDAAESKETVETVLKIANNRNQFIQLLAEGNKLIQKLEDLLKSQSIQPSHLIDINRLLHTLKGVYLSLSITHISNFIHKSEGTLGLLTRQKTLDEKALKKHLKEFASELKKKTSDFLKKYSKLIGNTDDDAVKLREFSVKDLHQFADYLCQTKDITEIRNTFVKTFCTIPLIDILKQFNLLIQSASLKAKKLVAPLEVKGESILILPEYYEDLMNNLIHVFTNSIAHGIENASDRIKAGKPGEGHISVSVSQVKNTLGDEILISIADDGRGIDIETLRAKLIKTFKNEDFEKVSDVQLVQCIFRENFSTNDDVSTLAGRGVGLSAVKASVEKMTGQIKAINRINSGLEIQIKIPLISQFSEGE